MVCPIFQDSKSGSFGKFLINFDKFPTLVCKRSKFKILRQKHVVLIIIVQVLIFCSAKIFAQSETVDFQTWSDFKFTHIINQKSNIGGDFGFRGVVSRNNWNQIHIRPTYKYFFNKIIQAAGGAAIFATVSDDLLNTYEFRLFQEATLAWPSFEFVRFRNRFRLEERFFTYQEAPSFGAKLSNDFKTRGRYQISLETMDIHFGNKNQPLYFLVAWEFFYDLNDVAIDRFINNQRTVGGFGHRLNSRFRYEVLYIYQRSRQFDIDGLKTTEHILRLRLFLLSKKPPKSD
jgi:Protein of unknown function (DUF2490)